jgi:hypothetical protein
MGQLERDAKKLGMELASDPAYGKATGCFWGGAICLGAAVWILSWLAAGASDVTSAGWVALAVGFGALVLIVFLVVTANGWRTRHQRRERRELRRLGRQQRKAARTPVRWW